MHLLNKAGLYLEKHNFIAVLLKGELVPVKGSAEKPKAMEFVAWPDWERVCTRQAMASKVFQFIPQVYPSPGEH